MVTKGERWLEEQGSSFHGPEDKKLEGKNRFRQLCSLSAKNLSNLKTELRPLSEEEEGFLSRGKSMKYCATHFTNNNLMETDTKGQKEPKVPKLYSRDRLESGGKIRFNKDNTTPADIEEFANTDHVFFALEPGDEPKKPESDFGKYRLRVPLDHPVFPQTASLIVNDQLEPHISADVRILKKYGADSPHAKEILKRHAENVGNIFVGKDMIPGLLMTAIRDSRKIRDKTGEDAKARGRSTRSVRSTSNDNEK